MKISSVDSAKWPVVKDTHSGLSVMFFLDIFDPSHKCTIAYNGGFEDKLQESMYSLHARTTGLPVDDDILYHSDHSYFSNTALCFVRQTLISITFFRHLLVGCLLILPILVVSDTFAHLGHSFPVGPFFACMTFFFVFSWATFFGHMPIRYTHFLFSCLILFSCRTLFSCRILFPFRMLLLISDTFFFLLTIFLFMASFFFVWVDYFCVKYSNWVGQFFPVGQLFVSSTSGSFVGPF